MLLPPISFKLLATVLLLCIPYYFFSKWLEKKMQPRLSGRRFAGWFFLIIASAIAYFWAAGSLYVYVAGLKPFTN